MKNRVKKSGKHTASPETTRKEDIMGRPKKDPTAPAKETNAEIVIRVKKSGALSPALSAALDEVATQLEALDAEYKKVSKQFKALTKL